MSCKFPEHQTEQITEFYICEIGAISNPSDEDALNKAMEEGKVFKVNLSEQIYKIPEYNHTFTITF